MNYRSVVGFIAALGYGLHRERQYTGRCTFRRAGARHAKRLNRPRSAR